MMYIEQSKIQTAAYWLVMATVFFYQGCRKPVEPAPLASGPEIEKIVVTEGYIARAIAAAGGYRNWMNSKELVFDCVVTFYKPDGSFYLTDHQYQIYPWSNSIRISAQEPQGSLLWQLSGGKFELIKGSQQNYDFPAAISPQDYADAILNITTTPVRFLESTHKFIKASSAVKIAGQLHYPIERTIAQTQLSESSLATVQSQDWPKVVFYQDKRTSLVDTICFTGNKAGEMSLAVRGYDYREIKNSGILVPTKIEIFRANPKVVLLQRLVEIDLKHPQR